MLRHNILGVTHRCDVACASDQSFHVAAQRHVAPHDYQFLSGEFSNLQIQLTRATESAAPPRKLFVCRSAQTIPPPGAVRSTDKEYPAAWLQSGRADVLSLWTEWVPPTGPHPRFAQPLRPPA